jgi:hypothetical protein
MTSASEGRYTIRKLAPLLNSVLHGSDRFAIFGK